MADAASSSDASTIYMNVEEMEDEEEEEQYFDVSDEVECDVSITLENVHSSTLFLYSEYIS